VADFGQAFRNWRKGFGLSSRLLALTILFVMLAEVLIFVPSVANFRDNWLNDRLTSARTAALVLEAAPEESMPEDLVRQLLESVGAEAIALKVRGTRRLLAITDTPDMVDVVVDLRERMMLRSIRESLSTLASGGNRSVRVIGTPPAGGDFIEIVLNEQPLAEALRRFALNILALSLTISGITATLVYLSLKRLIVSPVERLGSGLTRFAERPQDATRILRPSGRTDEIGSMESAVADMQKQVAQQLAQREHLAALGLAVSKVNHDLRNMLSSAQLISDRLGDVQDPTVQRFAPKLVQTLDRAITFCQATLAYGRAEERAPDLRPIILRQAMEEARAIILVDEGGAVGWANGVPPDMQVMADSEHLYRVAGNLFRNAVQAMETTPAPVGGHWLAVTARRNGAMVEIEITDTGPGVPPGVAKTMFAAFHGTTRPGGSGLGLAIAAELSRAQGGDIALVEAPGGACFRLTLKAG
jgi:signal transduction histidine kinase